MLYQDLHCCTVLICDMILGMDKKKKKKKKRGYKLLGVIGVLSGTMECRFTIYSLFIDVQKSFLDIHKSIFGYP